MIKVEGVIEKRGKLFVVMLPEETVKKENLKDGEKVHLIFKK